MRIPTGLFIRNFLHYIEKNTEKIFWNNQRIATGKRIQKPSDDVIGTAMAMKIRNKLNDYEQYIKNTDDAISWLSTANIAIDNILNIITRAQELATQAAPDIVSADERRAIGDEINQLLEELVALGNTKNRDRYIFGGKQTLTAPIIPHYTGGLIDSVTLNAGAVGDIIRKIGEGEEIIINHTAQSVFYLPTLDKTIFDVFIEFRDALYANDTATITQKMSELNVANERIRSIITEIGAKIDRLDKNLMNLDAWKIDLLNNLSTIEDTDMAKEIMELEKNRTIFQASLQIGTRILDLTILRFI